MRASRPPPVRQNRTKRKMSAYSSDLERFVERTTQFIIGRFKTTYRPLSGGPDYFRIARILQFRVQDDRRPLTLVEVAGMLRCSLKTVYRTFLADPGIGTGLLVQACEFAHCA